MSVLSARLSLTFSCIGHTYAHLFAPIFYITALSLEREWQISHGEAIALIVAGNVLYGVAAPLAGWLGDRWSSTGMMGLFFLGTGGAMTMVGFANSTLEIAFWLAVTGLFSSIYHPVGIAWLIRHAANRGTALGINGIFGGVGPGLANVCTGLLIALSGWRAAFVLPGALLLLTGLVFVWLVRSGAIVETKTDRVTDPPASRRDTRRAFSMLGITILCTGFIYQATQAGLPKVFSERLTEMIGGIADGLISAAGTVGYSAADSGGVFEVSLLVAFVYFTTGFLQLPLGMLADRTSPRRVYLLTYAIQVPALALAASLAGLPLFLVALIMCAGSIGSLPAENVLLARYTPSQWRGLAFGLKFILAFGVSGLGVWMEGALYDLTGDFWWLFTVLAGLAVIGLLAILMLPRERAMPVPAE